MIEAVLTLALQADPVPAVQGALALRGGALVLPLRAEPPAEGWPRTMQVVLRSDSGRRSLEGLLAWRSPRPTAVRHWGADPVPALLRPIARGDRVLDVRAKGVGPRLVLALPLDGEGHLEVGGHRVDLLWKDLPEGMPDLRLRSGTPLGPAPALRPSAVTPGADPLERWRWELLCAADGVHPPPLPPPGLDRLAAIGSAGPWRVLLHELAAADRGVAREVLDQLTRRVTREDEVIADWVTDPGRLASLVQGQAGDAATRARAALAWSESIPPVTAWLETPLLSHMTLALANGTTKPRVVELAWARPDEIPVAVRIPGRSVLSEGLDRPAQADTIALQTGSMTSAMRLPPRIMAPTPPGLALGPFLGPITLHDAQAAAPPPPPPADRRTWAQVRRVLGRWEVLLDCGRPAGAPEALPPGGATTLEALRGHDAVLIRLHVEGQEIPIVVHPAGWSCARGNVSRLEVRTARRGDAWISRVLLPEHWTVRGFGIELVRTHGGDEAIETALLAGTPWAMLPGPVTIDVDAWDR